MIQRLFRGESSGVTSAAILIAAASFASRAIGLLRDRVLAGEFGAGATLDMYYAAFRIPDFLFNLLVLGALSAGFIPVFTRVRGASGDGAAWRFASEVLTIICSMFAAVGVLVMITAPLFMPLIAPGFSPDAQAIVVQLTRIMMLSPLLLGVSAVFSGILHSARRFFIASLAPIAYNIGIMLGALLLAPRIGVAGLAWGVVAGALLHAMIQLPALTSVGFVFRPHVAWSEPIRSLVTVLVPRTVTLALGQAVLLVVTALASRLPDGSIAVFNFANNIQSFPIGIVGVAYAVAAFPALSSAATSGNRTEFTSCLSTTMRQALLFLIPATVLLITLKAQIIRVALGSGVFDWNDTIMTIETLEVFALGIVAQGLVLILLRAFWAHEDTLRPASAAAVAAMATIGLSIVLTPLFGVVGIALAISVGSVIQLLLLLASLSVHRIGYDGRRLMASTARMVGAAIVMAAVVQVGKAVLAPFTGTATFLGMLAQGAVSGTAGLLVYGGVLYLLRSPELTAAIAGFRRRLAPAPRPQEMTEDL